MLLEGEGKLGLHDEILDHVRCTPTDKTRGRVEVLSEVGRNPLIGWAGRPSTVETIICSGGTAGLGGYMHLGRCVWLDFEDAEAGWIRCGGDGWTRGLFTVAFPFAVATSAWCAGFDVVLETHVFGKSVRACERFITLYKERRRVGTGQGIMGGRAYRGARR